MFFACCCAPGDYISTPGCPCALTPATFYMHSNDTISNNHMFQNATMQWQTVPSSLSALGLGTSAFLSTAQFLDYTTGDSFWYLVSCSSGSYVLTRVYATSHYGSPYRDVVRYTWPVTGNSCSPWAMTSGTAYAGADPGTVVTLDTTP